MFTRKLKNKEYDNKELFKPCIGNFDFFNLC